jgi:5'-deoxynucleotidase YfbR-like HD superfamily hydrolase
VRLRPQLRKIALLRKGGDVKRWHTKPLIGEQTDAQHSFNAVNLLLVLHPNPTITLIKAVLWHDMAEQEVGDVPSPTLWKNGAYGDAYREAENAFLSQKLNLHMATLYHEEMSWLAGIDKLECYLFAREQLQLGNTGMNRTIRALDAWFSENRLGLPEPIMAAYRVIMDVDLYADLEDV